jgi:hypothetical protein
MLKQRALRLVRANGQDGNATALRWGFKSLLGVSDKMGRLISAS